ncbi:MAG TPA: TRAP transporter fused permease subunit [Syntrophorhabdaceae bacterium]|nr:TRAP transporter fused permease subunit [Syntrophorhabdaceae bacterium]HNT68775.1 TRAP transporter fused permease subunit [Syntrophorhabdaceae bacterium]
MRFDSVMKKVAKVIAILATLYHVYIGFFGLTRPLANYAITLSLFMCLTFLYVPFKGKGKDIAIFDAVLSLLSLVVGFYVVANYQTISVRPTMVGELTSIEYGLGILAILLVLESTRRTIGMPLVYIAVFFLVYCYFGNYLPGMFSHSGFSGGDIIESMYLTLDGIHGTPIAVVATLVIQFVLFGAFLEASGAAKFFVDISMSLMGRLKGAAGHIGNFSAALFGTMTGSPTASAVTVGSFSIPMMKKTGFTSIFSGAITAVSCTGAALMPPVMGTAAFLMAEMTGTRYIDICKAAIFPAILYFFSCSLIVYFEASRTGITGFRKNELPSFIKTIPISLQYMGPIAVLIILLIVGYAPALCAVVASFLIFLASFFRKTTRMNFGSLVKALEATAKTSISVATSCASAGIVVGAIVLTGLGGKFASIVVAVSHQSLFLALFLTMIASLILGMGMPLPVVYILTAVLCGPAIATLGIPIIAAHLFLVYFACISAVTPPVAVAAYATAAIAEDNPVKIGFAGFKYAIAGFIIPYVMIYEQSILLQGSVLKIAITVLSCSIGVFALSSAVSNWLFTSLSRWEKVLLFAGGALLVYPELITSLIGICCIAPVLRINYGKKVILKQVVANKTGTAT